MKDLSPAIRTVPMPSDANANGDIFGGWLLSQMDIAGGVIAAKRCKGRCVTIAIEAMKFYKPVYIGDLVTIFASVSKVGKTSMTINIDAFSSRQTTGEEVRVTSGTFVYVAIDNLGKSRNVD
ncbi:MAG: putative acyl-CoA thioester hydrolase [Alphaproteobacteria bacterium MarineAlpha2_Bin1]|nr:MAG: putative acyl-CoA thioester hydrolase [Alphaproteobacteria bacterium MarineAlpha2_Bin1]